MHKIYKKVKKEKEDMNLLIFFALPLATILLSIVLQRILKCPVLVSITFFAIYLIVAFAEFEANLAEAIIATIIYTILAFITSLIVQWISIFRKRLNDMSCCRRSSCSNNEENDVNNGNLLTISCNCSNGESSDLLTVNSSCGNEIIDNDDNTCGCNRNTNNTISYNNNYGRAIRRRI